MKTKIIFAISILALSTIWSFAQTSPYQNVDLPIDIRVNDLIARMTLEEKAGQLFNDAPAIPRLGVPAYNWWNECLHGVARAGKATVFPQAIGLAATFDEPLMFRLATAISDEARAKHHYFVRNNARGIYMGLTFWTPNINIFRDPRWGRGQETYGEDPYLTGRMALNFIKGLQGNDPKYLKTIATAKHYAVHSGPEFTRHSDNIFVNDRDLYETYLPAFKVAVKDANVQSVMCGYNRFRDQPCCGSDVLLSNILRKEYGFNGYIVSDCGAITDFYNKTAHHIVNTPEQAFGWSLSAGTDLNCEMPNGFLKNIGAAAQQGVINEKDINASLTRLFSARMKLGMFDPEDKQPYSNIPMSKVGSKEHLDLALESAEKSLVLLKNDGILPLKKTTKVALIGPNANNPAILISNYNGEPINPITPLKGIRERLGTGNVLYATGCQIVPGVFTDFDAVKGEYLFHTQNGKLEKGLHASYYKSTTFEGTPAIERIDKNIEFYWEKSPINQAVDESFAVRWSGVLVAPRSASYVFSGNLKVKINGDQLSGQEIKLENGIQYILEAELVVANFWWSNNHQQQFAILSWVEASHDYRKEALDAARKADVIIFCGGISTELEGEEMPLDIDGFTHGDRTHLNLPAIQETLLKDLYKTGKPIVYVNFSGSAIALNWEAQNLSAIIQAFYPGEATGTALARVLFGETNPSGRLPITFYKSVDDLPDFKDYNMQGRTYRYFKGEPLYEFGYGLSYSSFRYANLVIPITAVTGEHVKVSIDVTNAGKMEGEEVVQLYISHKGLTLPMPIHALAGFKRVLLKIGETRKVEFTLTPSDLSFIDEAYQRVEASGKIQIAIGGRQPNDKTPDTGSFRQGEITTTGKLLVVD